MIGVWMFAVQSLTDVGAVEVEVGGNGGTEWEGAQAWVEG